MNFPKTICSLWDKTATGNDVFLHIGYYRKPKVCIQERILRLIQHQCENYAQTHHMLIGTLVVEDDGEGVQLQVDRLDTRDKIPSDGSGLAPGDLLIPLEVSNNTDKERCGSVEDYNCALKRLENRCSSQSPVDLCEFMLLRGWGSFYSNAHSSVMHLDFDMVAMETVFRVTPILSVPILLTALSKNLAGPMSLSHVQGSPKTGYLSMDHTRKVLLVLESDPKACTLPLVGIWVSGTDFVQHPFVWASCLRFIHNKHLQDRVCAPPEDFLLVLYTPLHSKPEFYQVCPTSGTSEPRFQLRTGHDLTNLSKALSAPCADFTEVELESVDGGRKMEMFDAAKAQHGLDLFKATASAKNFSFSEDIEPRSAPTPYMEKANMPSIRPMVPDVSILWTDPAESFPSQPYHHQPSNFPRSPQTVSQPASTNMLGKAYMSQGLHSHRSSHSVPTNANNSCNVTSPSYTPASIHQRVPSANFNVSTSFSGHLSSGGIMSQNFQPSSPYAHNLSPSTNNIGNKGPHFQSLNGKQQTQASQHSPMTQPTPRSSLSQGHQGISTLAHPTSAQRIPESSPSVGYHSHNSSYSSNPSHIGLGHQHSPYNVNNTPNMPANTYNPHSLAQNSHYGQSAQSSVSNHSLFTFLKTVVEEGSVVSMPSPAHSSRQVINSASAHAQAIRIQNNSGHNSNNCDINSTACQSSDDDDSGLSIPPDQANSSPHHQHNQQQSHQNQMQQQQEVASSAMNVIPTSANNSISVSVSLSSNNALSTAPQPVTESGTVSSRPAAKLDNVNWDQVPPAVQALLQQQNQQLQLLQQQIQMLLLNQSQQMAAASSSSSANNSHQTLVVSASAADQRQNGTPSIDARGNVVFPPPSSGQSGGTNSKCACQHNTSSSRNSSSSNQDKTEVCSVGVNTTVAEDCSEREASLTRDTTQRSPAIAPPHPDLHLSPVLSDGASNTMCGAGLPASGTTPSELQHHNQAPVSSTTYESPAFTPRGVTGSKARVTKQLSTVSVGENEVERRDLASVMASLPIQEQTMPSESSQLVLDMPEYVSSVNDGFTMDQTRSPPSVSECFNQGQDDSYSTVAEDALDPKQYYSQLMNNIQMFLKNDKAAEEELLHGQNNSSPMLQVSSPLKCCDSGGENSANSSFTPRINYVSLMFDSNNGSSVFPTPGRGAGTSMWGSDPGQSMEINAMAMKYLSDEQLTQMALLQRMQEGKGKKGSQGSRAKALQQVLKGGGALLDETSTDISRLGISPNDMTMATQKYLEKHGLLSGNDSMMLGPTTPSADDDHNLFDRSLKLRTDFSMARLSSDGDAVAKNNSGNAAAGVYTPEAYTPVKVLSSKDRNNFEKRNLANHAAFTKGQQLNAFKASNSVSPVALPGHHQHASPKQHLPSKASTQGPQPWRADTRCRQATSPLTRETTRRLDESATTEEAEEENLLDIARLKQMPKLL